MSRRVFLAVFLAAAGLLAIAVLVFSPTGSRGGTPMVAVQVPPLEGAAVEGAQLFDARCASCHGADAAGREGVAPPLVHRIYEPGHHGDAAFHRAVQMGTRAHHWTFGDMPPVEGVTEREVDRIVAYVRTLQRANGIF